MHYDSFSHVIYQTSEIIKVLHKRTEQKRKKKSSFFIYLLEIPCHIVQYHTHSIQPFIESDSCYRNLEIRVLLLFLNLLDT